MKKTSLLLAIGALLYGTGVYALPDITPNMSDEDLLQVIDQMGDVPQSDVPKIAEDAPALPPGTDPTDGLEPAQALPPNVALDNSNIVKKHKMCSLPETGYSSSAVDGDEMAEFPVTVWTSSSSSGMTCLWKKVSSRGGQADFPVCVGTGWIWKLAQNGDTWSAPWMLYTTVPITKILLEPLLRSTLSDPPGMKRVYTFDVGGKQNDGTFNEHTKGAARGQYIIRSTSSPNVTFTATYSDPVYITDPPAHPVYNTGPLTLDGHDIPLIPPAVSTGDSSISRKPTHDLYGKLEIDFPNPVQGTSALNLAFAFVADTDCLPVVGARVSSNLLTLFGEGLVYVNETKADGSSSLMSPAFEVMKEGVNTFDVSDLIAKLKAGSCYSLVNENSLGTNIPLEVNGVDMPNAAVCP